MALDRRRSLDRLAAEEFDVVAVGGGITGAGCALDAVTRGWRTALVERDDFGSGTSSRSSKLVHGGIRYLEHREFGLVRESLAERQIALRNAPHLVHVVRFLIPIMTRDGAVDRRLARGFGALLWMYDLSGGVRIKKVHRRLDHDGVLALVPTLRADRIVSGYMYYDAHADDARLTLTVARTATDHGAVVANHTRVVAITKDASGRANGVRVLAAGEDGGPRREFVVRARVVVNATGVWTDEVRSLDTDGASTTIRPAKGVHVSVPWTRVRNEVAMAVRVPEDGRSVFVVPWGDTTYIGTTDDDYRGDLDHPRCTADEVAYLLQAVNHVLDTPIDASDVTGTWAGLRPLLDEPGAGRTTDLSRRHGVHTSEAGVITVTGGKLTTYRSMARDVVDRVDRTLDGRRRRCRTARLPLSGARGYRPPAADAPVLDHHLAARYGTEAAAVRALLGVEPGLAAPLVPGLPYLQAEAVYAVRAEMACTLGDVLDRRTRSRVLDRGATADAAEAVAHLLAPWWGWDDRHIADAVDEYRAELAAEAAATRAP